MVAYCIIYVKECQNTAVLCEKDMDHDQGLPVRGSETKQQSLGRTSCILYYEVLFHILKAFGVLWNRQFNTTAFVQYVQGNCDAFNFYPSIVSLWKKLFYV